MTPAQHKNPYRIDEPAAISFSGGRTSAYMLYRILEAHDGKLPDDVKVAFANTGKEMPQTLDFVDRCAREWGVDIAWLELAALNNIDLSGDRRKFERVFRVTNYAEASRNGEPFHVIFDAIPAIPNATQRSCTGYMKSRPIKDYLKSLGYELPFLTYIGIRADENRRAAKIHNQTANGADCFCPLWVDGITAADVGNFWKSSPFDLELPNNNGTTDWGNCDLCFLKGRSKRAAIIRERPDLADWWIEAEKKKGQQFRADEIGYAAMKHIALNQPDLFEGSGDETIPCFCGD